MTDEQNEEYAEEYAVLRGETNMYKGVEVVWIENNLGSFSYGKIYLNTTAKDDISGVRLLRHEYGHTIQLEKLGHVNYLIFVVTPSVTLATLANSGNDFAQRYYYSFPWEYEADLYGNVPDRGIYHPYTQYWYHAYRQDVNETT